MRQDPPWGDVVRVLNRDNAGHWTVKRLRRAVWRLARRVVQDTLLNRAGAQPENDRLIRLVAAIKAAGPNRMLQQMDPQLEAMRERTPRGGARWHPPLSKACRPRRSGLGWRANAPAMSSQTFGGDGISQANAAFRPTITPRRAAPAGLSQCVAHAKIYRQPRYERGGVRTGAAAVRGLIAAGYARVLEAVESGCDFGKCACAG